MVTPIKILAVDDDPVFLMLFQHVLNSLGYTQVQCFETGEAALNALHTADPAFDCLFMDIDMPGMTGIELCRRARSLPDYRQTPIIMVTAMKTLGHVEDSFRMGATDYVRKPVEALEIGTRLRVIGDLLQERRRRQRMEARISNDLGLSLADIGLDDHSTIGPAGAMVDYQSLQNYLQTLSRFQLYRHTLLAFKLANMDMMYQASDAQTYLAIQASLAKLIAQTLSPNDHVIASAGEGEFIALISGRETFNQSDIEAKLSANLTHLAGFYREHQLPLPDLRVGSPYQTGLILRAPADQILTEMRQAMRGKLAEQRIKADASL